VGSFIRIGPGIEEGQPSSCGGAPRGVVLGGHKILSPPCVLRSQNLPYVSTAVCIVADTVDVAYCTASGHGPGSTV
jgi:hypothetical protein